MLGSSDGVIKLGPVTKKDLPPGPLADGVFSLPVGVGPAPIQSLLGWHIVRINSVTPGKAVPFDEVKEKLEKELRAQLAPDLLINTDFERMLAKTQSMKAAAEDPGAQDQDLLENVDARGQDAEGKQIVIGPAASELVQAAFATVRARKASFWRRSAAYFIAHRPHHARPHPALTEVEAKVTDAWQAEERRKLADAKVKEALDKANAGTGFEALAKELGLEMRTAKPSPASRPTRATTSPSPWQELFKLQEGKTQSVRTAEGSVLVRLKQIEPVDLTKDKEAIDRFGKQLDSMVANDLILQLIAAMRTKYGVVVDEAAFVAAFRPQNQP